MGRRGRWLWRALVGGLILALPAGALLFVRVPVLAVIEVKAGRRLLALQVRAGESFVLSYRRAVTQDLVSGAFEVESDGALSLRETTCAPPCPGPAESRPGELSFFVYPFTNHTLVVKGQTLNLSRQVQPGSLVEIHVERQFWWRKH